MDQTFYLTTPIYYVNAEPHLGHAYSTVVADVSVRFHRLLGRQARLQTGTDEHGDKIAQAAEAQGIEPKQYVDRISQMFRDLWPPLNIQPDNFIRTTDPAHVKVVQAVLQKVHDQGDIYFAKYGGKYCVGCERFYTEHELVDGKCPDHQTEPVYIEEENYFFKMSAYQERLLEHIKAKPDFIRPERYRNEVLAMLAEPLEDLCISRPKTRLTWGIDLPFDPKFVTYVWFDALINYISGLDWPDGELFGRFWPAAQHLIAKDILKPHAIYWPTMLMAAGLEPYQHLNVHGYWNVGAGKMSKSVGNVVRPLDLAQVYGPDAFRYFLMREMTFGLDASFSQEALVERYNADLANDLGNLFSRVMNMLHRYRDGLVPSVDDPKALAYPATPSAPKGPAELAALYQDEMTGFAFHNALAHLWELVRSTNKFIVEREPWELAKDPGRARELDQVLFSLVQVLADVAVMVWPVMPATAEAMAQALGLGPIADNLAAGWLEKIKASEPLVAPATQTTLPEALFPRIDTERVQAKAAKAEAKTAAKEKPAPAAPAKKAAKAGKSSGPAPEVTIEEFARLELKVGLVVQAEAVKGADRLLKLMVDLGEDRPRQVVAGIAQHYTPEQIIGHRVMVVANLKPVTLKGVESRGMVLAGIMDGGLRVIEPDPDLPPGSKVR